MANDIPDLMAVRYKGSGNVQVYPLLNGITLGSQDGNDVLVGTLETGLQSRNNHANRLIEAFGKRFLLHGLRVYERDEGGSGNWGEVTGLALSATDHSHSGLHLLHPAGIPTLAFLHETGTNLHVVKTTDGTTWTNTDTGLSFGSAITQNGDSIVFRDSIFWYARGSDGNEVRSYDFNLLTATEHNVPTIATGEPTAGMHVHQGELFLVGIETSTQDFRLWRLDGSVFTFIYEFGPSGNANESNFALWSDGNDLIHATVSNSALRAKRASDVLMGGSVSHVAADIILSNCTNISPCGFVPFVASHPNPSTAEQRVYFWQRTGGFNTGNYNLFRFEYRQITTAGSFTGAFQLGETVTGGTSGATGIITDIVVDTSLSLTDVVGTFQSAEVLTGGTSGATMTSNSTLVDVAATSLGTGISAVNFGLPRATDGGLDRIPSLGSARPAFNGQPTEVVGGRRRPFVIWGTEATGGDINLALYYSANSEAPDQRGTISAISIADIPVTTGLVGNLGEVALEALSPTAGDAYVVSNVDGDGSLTPGALSINEGDIVEYDGANWTFAHATANPTVGVPDFTIHAKLSTDTALIAPYTDGVDDGKTVAFDGTSLTGILLSTPSIISNEARDLTPTNGATTYYITHNSAVDGLSSGDRVSVILDIV